MSLFNQVVRITGIQDCYLDKEKGLIPVNVLEEARAKREPTQPIVICVNVTHWFLFKKKYVLHPNVWQYGHMIDYTHIENKTANAGNVISKNDNSRLFRIITEAVSIYSLEMLVKLNAIFTGTEGHSAEVINLADHRANKGTNDTVH